MVTRATPHIGTLNESPLHASLKRAFAEPGDRFEVAVDGYVVDILRGELIIEIQTANFSSIAKKLRTLTQRHEVLLILPIAQDLWIEKLPLKQRGKAARRKSPKHGAFLDVFDELVSIPDLIAHPNFRLQVVLTREEEARRHDSRRRWRRGGWATVERRLVDIVDTRTLATERDVLALLPQLPERFLTSDIADAAGCPRALAQRAAYSLRNAGLISNVGKRGNALVYSIAAPGHSRT